MMNRIKPLIRRMYRSDQGRRLFFLTPLSIARRAHDNGYHKVAIKTAKVAHRYAPNDVRVLYLLAKSLEGTGLHEAANVYRAKRLRHLLPKHIEAKNFTAILIMMAEMERTHHSSQFSAGRAIALQLVSEVGRRRILKCALEARKRFQESAYLNHLITLCQAMEGDYRSANDLLQSEIKTLQAKEQKDKRLQTKRHRMLEQSWRVVDLIAREQMDWADDSRNAGTFSEAFPQPRTYETAKLPVVSHNNASFKEHALQGRQRDTYLELCDKEFHQAKNMQTQLKAIEDMMRTGVRHVPDYTSSYALAQKRLASLQPKLDALFNDAAFKTVKVATQSVLELCTVLRIARRLHVHDLVDRVVSVLNEKSENSSLAAAFWPAPATLAADSRDTEIGDQIMARIETSVPKINRDMQYFFRWAEITRRYDAAHAFYKRLPKNLYRRAGLLYYVNILQREGQFVEAIALLSQVHGQSLCNPSNTNAFTNYSLIKRAGELRFLLKTAQVYRTVPQPRKPQGVLLVGPRNIDQLRRYPLMVLLEFKRRGWAVVPIVEGFLPKEKTGIPEIDVMNGALSANIRFSADAEAKMRPVTDFHFNPETAELKWGNIDLGHHLWEDAAINRRRYNIDWSCPELKKYLAGLSDWTHAMARVMQYAKDQHSKTKLSTACISLFNCRLPDSLFRFYCEEHGDPDTFFYLHAANGYQNYFTNFTTNISHRMVLRNITRHPEVRSSSFPLPEYFAHYYDSHLQNLPEIMERFVGITKVKRSTEGNKVRPPEVTAVDTRINSWRAKGGKVACAFGKVVCDSSVPFDGGPAHTSMKDWINHCINTVENSNTLLLIKPHPHELNNQIATFPTEYFRDLLEEELTEQVIFLGHRWFDIHDMESRMDLGLIYNGTTAVELGIMGTPCILAGHYTPIDYPVGHAVPKNREHFEAMLRYEVPVNVAPDLKERCAMWLDYMANDNFTQPYRYHSRPVTNKVLYPPFWFEDDLEENKRRKDPAVEELVGRALGERMEPGSR